MDSALKKKPLGGKSQRFFVYQYQERCLNFLGNVWGTIAVPLTFPRFFGGAKRIRTEIKPKSCHLLRKNYENQLNIYDFCDVFLCVWGTIWGTNNRWKFD